MIWVRDKKSGEVVWQAAAALEREFTHGDHAHPLTAPTPTIATCPLCGHAMSEHSVDRSSPKQLIVCPVPVEGSGERDPDSVFSMLGMPRRRRTRAGEAGQ